jgi:hypothetical protein
MTARILQNLTHKILVVGPVYDQLSKLVKLESLLSDYSHIIVNGNLCYPNDNLDEVQKRIDIMSVLCSRGVIYNLGNFDLKLLSKLEESGEYPKIQKWLKEHNNVVIAHYHAQPTYIITSGGITPEMTKEDIVNGLETSFVSKVKDAPWHRWYGGGHGYVISNMPLTFSPPQFYNFSAQIGNVYHEKVEVYAQEAGPGGLGRTFPL